MTTLSDLVNDVLLAMEGYGLDQGRAAFLTGTALTSSGLTFTVDDTSNVGPGIAEIGDELVYIQSVDDTTKTVTVSADGRGYRGTTPATHAVGARVTSNPVLPRGLVKRKINETITGVYPNLFGQSSTTVTWNQVTVGYTVPADLEEVLQVTYQEFGPSEAWLPVRRWKIDHNADTTKFPTGKALYVYEGLYATHALNITYQHAPTELSLDSDDLTASGLRASARAAVVAGTVWRLASFIDISRIKVNTADANAMASPYPMGTGTQISAYLRKQYEVELADEKTRQALATPPIMHFEE